MLLVFQYPQCGTCKKALRFLAERGVVYQSIDITLSPPSPAQLRAVMRLAGVGIAQMFNTSGQSYRMGGFKDRLPKLSEEQALTELSSDGKLIKRPLVLGNDFALVGFKVEQYEARFPGA